MAAQAKIKETKPSQSAARRKSAAKPASKKQTMAQLQEECNRLQTKLEASEARVAELEILLEETVNRIEWAIDLLHNATQDRQ